ncbi:MAG TPA: hypothetical protein VF719_08555, partial [Abditibacteriaceae bacterium]
MNPRTYRLLELDKILARLEEATATTLGRNLAHALKTSSDIAEVQARLAQTSEARRFVDELRHPPFGGISDVQSQLKNASIGALLDAHSLLAVALFTAGARRLREAILRSTRAEFPILHHDASLIVPRPDIERAILEAIDEDTREIKDDASIDLLRARRNIRQTQSQIGIKLRQMLSDPNVQPHLQDAFVTVRDGRYCLPVKAENRARVPGIVHDRSGSGGAFFVEPQAVVEMNNRLRELHSDEREAIQAILSALSARVAGATDDLIPSLQACACLDFAFAKANLSLAMKGIEVPVSLAREGASYALLQACHPLVNGCVPNNILLGDTVEPDGAKSTTENG